MKLGIDFGTTHTVVACADRGNHPVVDFVDEAGDARGFIPSVVAERGGELRFGFDALAVAGDPSFAVVRSFKRLLSSPDVGPASVVTIGSAALPVADLLARFLAHVRDAVRSRSTLRRKLASESELRAAVGVPANAFAGQRLMTLDAFRAAGFAVTGVVNEPSAAGFEYTHRHRSTLTSHRDTVVVYDMGGGTFDASLVRMAGRHHEVVAASGVNTLGGDDFDAALSEVALAAAGISPASLSGVLRDRWIEQCRMAKESLHANSRKVTLDLEAVFGKDAPRPEVSVPVAAYYEACTPLVERSIAAMEPLIGRAEAAEGHARGAGGRAAGVDGGADGAGGRAAGVDGGADGAEGGAHEIAGIYVVGGASELPIIGRALRERFGRRVHRSPYPSAAVAIGLSIANDDEGDFRLVDRTSRTFAVFREADAGREIVLDPIFTREAVLPKAGEPAVFTRTYRAAHNVGHYRFFECSAVDGAGKPRGDMAQCRDVFFPFDERLVDRQDLASVPVERRFDQGPAIVEHYSLDHNGIVHVRIRNADAGYERRYRVGG